MINNYAKTLASWRKEF